MIWGAAAIDTCAHDDDRLNVSPVRGAMGDGGAEVRGPLVDLVGLSRLATGGYSIPFAKLIVVAKHGKKIVVSKRYRKRES